MRILHFAKYAFQRSGGMERHVEVLTQGLVSAGLDVTVIVYDPSGLARTQTVKGVHVEPVRPLWHIGSQAIAPTMLSTVLKLSRKSHFDIVHQHWPDPFAHVVASLVPGRPAHLASWHSDIVRQRIVGPLYLRIAPHLLRQPDAVLGATSAHLRSHQIEGFASAARRHVIPYGIDTTRLAPTAEVVRKATELRHKYGHKSIVFALGRHVYYKGFDVLIRAMKHVPAMLLLGGEGPLTPELRRLAADSGGQVDIVGQIPESDLPAYFHACDVFCLPSVATAEAFGIVQAEAMACGKPIVNTWLGNGVNELAENGRSALTVSPGDPVALATALNALLSDLGLAHRLGETGKKRIHDDFTSEVMVKNMVNLYKLVLTGR